MVSYNEFYTKTREQVYVHSICVTETFMLIKTIQFAYRLIFQSIKIFITVVFPPKNVFINQN